MAYPTRSEYVSSIKNPEFSFKKKDPVTKVETVLDKSLALGQPVKFENSAGQEVVWFASGNFACVFKYMTFSPNQTWAVRCFLKSPSNIIEHYEKINKHLKSTDCKPYFADFELIKEGIRVNGSLYPILKMEWIEGQNIKDVIKYHLGNRKKLRELADDWLQLTKDLHNDRIAHGDLQHGNILVVENGGFNLKLVDYDSLYFERYSEKVKDEIKGLPGYQHPFRNYLETQCIETDFFSSIVIHTSILALAERPELWQRYNVGDSERLLFSESDLVNPDNSTLFNHLIDSSLEVSSLAFKLKTFCQLTDIAKIPSLSESIGGETISVKPKREKASKPKTAKKETQKRQKREAAPKEIEKETSKKRPRRFLMLGIGVVSGLAILGSIILVISDLNKLNRAEDFVEKSASFKESKEYSVCITMANEALKKYNQVLLLNRIISRNYILDRATYFRENCQLSKDDGYLDTARKFLEANSYLNAIENAQKVTIENTHQMMSSKQYKEGKQDRYSMAQKIIRDSVETTTKAVQEKYNVGRQKEAIEEMRSLFTILLEESDFYKQVNATINAWETTWKKNEKNLKEAQIKAENCKDLSEAKTLAKLLTTPFYEDKANRILSKAQECEYKAISDSARTHYNNGALIKAIETIKTVPEDSKFYNEANELRNIWQGEYDKAKSDVEGFLDQYFSLINYKNFKVAFSNYLTDDFIKLVVKDEKKLSWWKHVKVINTNLIGVKSKFISADVSLERREISTIPVDPETHIFCLRKFSSSPAFKFEVGSFCK